MRRRGRLRKGFEASGTCGVAIGYHALELVGRSHRLRPARGSLAISPSHGQAGAERKGNKAIGSTAFACGRSAKSAGSPKTGDPAEV